MNEHVALRPSEAGYDTDFFEWSMQQAELLRAGRLDLVDRENIAEEIEGLGNSDKRQVATRMARVIEHLLKLRFSTAQDPRTDWRVSATYQRQDIELIFEDSPSLRARRDDSLPRAWKMGVNLARKGLSEEVAALAQIDLIAADPIFTVDQILDDEFFPGD
ncbi:DUF29 domain-containing protein [Polymorphobacter sp. PAMC 29334]|uniref:DUF29 domain-containing protein n=1 Tax=Polymorphobacter sp. PAMC 29334 TaxID=2862331 RepID=UPI001C682C08|nr:DUF29 domain-containing protein [Polymorphobacter sp. PAMC 29334]QYE34853.1 DUF29 domain-containing protein [Polymorphobacter sp. PAMC 29334]